MKWVVLLYAACLAWLAWEMRHAQPEPRIDWSVYNSPQWTYTA